MIDCGIQLLLPYIIRLLMEELCHYIHQQVMTAATTRVAGSDQELNQLMRCLLCGRVFV